MVPGNRFPNSPPQRNKKSFLAPGGLSNYDQLLITSFFVARGAPLETIITLHPRIVGRAMIAGAGAPSELSKCSKMAAAVQAGAGVIKFQHLFD